MDRCWRFGIERGAAVPVDGAVALGLVLRTGRRERTESAAHATARRAVHAHTFLRRSKDGRGRALDNVFVERLWRTVKYEDVYLKDYSDPSEALRNLRSYFSFYNGQRPHQALDYRTPQAVYFGILKKPRRPLRGNFS